MSCRATGRWFRSASDPRLRGHLQVLFRRSAQLVDPARAASTVINPPHTAASSIATPSGRPQCQPRKAKDADSVFWAMNTSKTMRMTKPTISANHSAAARVNLTADSGGALGRVIAASGGTCCGGIAGAGDPAYGGGSTGAADAGPSAVDWAIRADHCSYITW